MVHAWLLLLALPAVAQVKFGDFSTNLNGNISLGYTADFGNLTSSDHGWTFGGVANYSGYFYRPSFLAFSAAVYLNQSRANSDYQSISNASGGIVSASIFAGSRFPGSVSYSKAYNSDGSYSVPGVANYVTHGNSDAFGINWSEELPNLPTLSAGFETGTNTYTVYGTNDSGKSSFHSVNLNSNYQLVGISMGAFYTLGGSHTLIPQFVAGQAEPEAHSNNNTYGFNASHRLPWRGSVSTAITRTGWGSEYLGTNTSGNIDLLTAVASVQPTNKLAVSTSLNYSDNLSGQLLEAVVATGTGIPGLNTNESSNALDLMSVAGYALAKNLQTSAYVERRSELFLGNNYGVTSYGGSASYAHPVFNGNFNASVRLNGNIADQTGEDTLGFSTTENYSSDLLGWHVDGQFGYSQNVQTLLITYMSSSYDYSGSVRRRWGRFSVNAGAGGSRTALAEEPGTANVNESYEGGFSFGSLLTANGNYTKSSGQAIATGSGLVPVPIPSPILPSSLVSLYGGTGYSAGLSSAPARGLVLSASWSKSSSNTASNGTTSLNDNDEYNALIQYQVRKLNFTSGYARMAQGFSGSGSPPEVISSFYFGVSRWFNFF